MLAKFAVTNYRGFKERIEWDLSSPSNYAFNNFAVKNGIVKNGIIYGPNGSGKSNMGLAVFDIANHLSHKWKKPDYYVNFANASNMGEVVDFEYTFKFNGTILEYAYSKRIQNSNVRIVKERLLLDGKEMLYKDEQTAKLSGSLSLPDTAIDGFQKSANNISLINFLLISLPLPKGHFLLLLRYFVENMLFFRSLDNREFIGLKEGGSNIEEYLINNGLVDEFSEFLKTVSRQDFNFAKPMPGDKMLFCVFGETKIPFALIASTGTLNLELQFFWLCEMKNASFVFVDEFDAFYHHELSFAICKQLFKGEMQTFVSTHDTFLLTNDLLRPDCFFILNNKKIKAICDLTDKELRLGHNLEKLYRGGTFGVCDEITA